MTLKGIVLALALDQVEIGPPPWPREYMAIATPRAWRLTYAPDDPGEVRRLTVGQPVTVTVGLDA